MTKKEWAIHVIAYNGVDTFVFSGAKKAAEDTRKEILKDVGVSVSVSKVIPMVPGAKHWVVHIRMKNGKMKSFGFTNRSEATKFHKDVMRILENFDCVSFPAKGELK